METRPGGDVGDEHRDEEGETRSGPFSMNALAIVLEGLHPSDAAADQNSGAFGRGELALEPRLGDRLLRGAEARTARTGRSAGLPCGPCTGVGSNPLTSQANRTPWLRGVELGDRGRARPAGQQAGPGSSTVLPTGVTSPRPVTTTRRYATTSRSSRGDTSEHRPRCAASPLLRPGCRCRIPSRTP